MSKLQPLRLLVNERLTVAAEEIFSLFERTIAEYEEKLCRSEKENQRKQRLLNEVNQSVLQPRVGVRVQIPSASLPGATLNQKITETVQIKEEPEEQRVKQEEEQQLPVFVPESNAFCVKTEENPLLPQIQTEHREETQEEDRGASNSETERDTGHSSDTDNEDWRSPISPADAQMETELTQRSGTGEKLHTCAVCKKIFSDKCHLKRHMRTHTGEKPHICSVCKKTFNQKDNLKRHMRIHTGEKPYSCLVCNKSFNQNGDLTKHMRTHTGEKPYRCPVCKKTFTETGTLKTHMRTHTGEKPHSCSICKKTFIASCNLKRHLRTHTGEKPHSCLVCEKTFNQKAHLRRHMINHTGENADVFLHLSDDNKEHSLKRDGEYKVCSQIYSK